MKWRYCLALLVAIVLGAGRAGATLVERVVAVVEDKAILLSELRARAKPFLVRIYSQVPDGAQRTAAISEVYSELIERLVEEELKERSARRAHITITSEEIDSALERIARQNDLSVPALIAEATRTGLTESEYRLEVRRQLLEAKLLNLRLQSRVQVTDQDVRNLYREAVMAERRTLPFRAAQIRVDAPVGAAPQKLRRARRLAERLARLARSGADFAELARKYSSDPATREAGGLLSRAKPGQLPASLDQVCLGLEVGEVSNPVRVGNQFAVIKLVERAESALPSYSEAEGQLRQRAYLQKMDRARQQWLKGLRRQTHVEVRL